MDSAYATQATQSSFCSYTIRETLQFHVEGMIADGDDVPQWLREGDYEFEYQLDALSKEYTKLVVN